MVTTRRLLVPTTTDMQPYRSADVNRQARRLQRKRERPLGPARQASLARKGLRRHHRRLLLLVFVTTITMCAIKDLVLYLIHK